MEEIILNYDLWDEGVHGAVKAMRVSAKALRERWAGPGGVRTRTSTAGTSEEGSRHIGHGEGDLRD